MHVIPKRGASSQLPETADVVPLRCTGAAVRRLARRITSFYEVHMQATGIKLSQYSVLSHVYEEPQSLLALSRRLEMDRTTLTRNLKPLLANRWVAQTPGEDARQRLFTITPAGKRARRQAREAWRKAQIELERHLGERAIVALHEQLDHALKKLKAVLPGEN